MDDDSEKKAKGTKKCVIKRLLKFNNYGVCLFDNKIILGLQQRFNPFMTEAVIIKKPVH